MSKGIVTLCGSVRFEAQFRLLNRDLTLADWIVLAPGCFEHEWLHRPDNNAELRKDGLDKLHCEKIDLSDSVLIINVAGYVGQSTQAELNYAIKHHKKIFWYETSPYLKERQSWKDMIEFKGKQP